MTWHSPSTDPRSACGCPNGVLPQLPHQMPSYPRCIPASPSGRSFLLIPPPDAPSPECSGARSASGTAILHRIFIRRPTDAHTLCERDSPFRRSLWPSVQTPGLPLPLLLRPAESCGNDPLNHAYTRKYTFSVVHSRSYQTARVRNLEIGIP